ncbi:MAG: hypothetical protein J7L15_08320 [Clostridiales bacterium]|nr:hypothetical protein [Clostridiales bacterium]
MSNTAYVETVFCHKTYKDPSTGWLQVRIYDEFNRGEIDIPTINAKPSDCGVNLKDDLSILQYVLENMDYERDSFVELIFASMSDDKRGCYINDTEYDFDDIKHLLELE